MGVATSGYLYCAINPSLPGLIKIGTTTKHPLERVRELSAPTGVPTPFVLAYHRAVYNPFKAELHVHELLDAFRISDSREFFKLPLHEAIKTIDSIPENAYDVSTPWAELFATFPDDGRPRNLTFDEQLACSRLREKCGIMNME